jgi:hypothetical protein
MRSGDDIGGAIPGSDAQYLEAFIEGTSAVIDAGKDMGVNIDHQYRMNRRRERTAAITGMHSQARQMARLSTKRSRHSKEL